MNFLDDSLQLLADERANLISSHLRAHHDQFKLLSHTWADYFNTLKANLPEDSQHLLLQYEEITNSLYSISQDYIYKQGLKDGAQLIKYLCFEQFNDLP